jgi:hypothetical protein
MRSRAAGHPWCWRLEIDSRFRRKNETAHLFNATMAVNWPSVTLRSSRTNDERFNGDNRSLFEQIPFPLTA